MKSGFSIPLKMMRDAGWVFLALFLAGAVASGQTVTPATGGGAIPADNAATVGGPYITLTGPVYSEAASGNAGVGTIILNAPTGFEFDTGGLGPTVLITRIGGNGNNRRNINEVSDPATLPVTSRTATQITFTITSASNSGVTNSLTWQNIRVRPTLGTPLASGNIFKTGTSVMAGVTAGSGGTNFGTLTEVAGAINKLVVTLPGQTFTAGTGNTGSPTAQNAGTSFTITRIRATDQFFNIVTSYSGAKTLSYSGPGGSPTYTTSVSFTNGQSTTALTTTLRKAETTTITVGDGTTTGPASSSLTVNAGTFVKLQLLVPGETADPGTASGKSGTPSTQTSSVSFSATVRSVDANWNLVSSSDVVRLTSTDPHAVLPAAAALTGGTRSFSVILKTAGSRTLTAIDTTNGSITSNTSPSITVNPGPLVKLQLLVPGETADPGSFSGKTGSPTARTAGTPFNVTVNTVDASWNVVSSTDVVSLTSTDSYAVLPPNTALVAGTTTLSVTLKTAGSATLTAQDVTTPSVTSSTSPSIVVNPGAFTKLQILVPGESAVPGSSTGKTGTADPQTSGAAFNVTVNGVDANWNLVSSVTDVVRITSTDPSATLPSDAALVAGTKIFSVTLATVGSQKVVASDITTPAITADSSSTVTVNSAGTGTLTPATGGETISADSVGGSYTALTGPVYEEGASANISTGTIILNAPSGFEFATSPVPTVLIQRIAGSGPNSNNINGVASGTSVSTSVSSSQVTLTITSSSSGGVQNSLTWQNVRVRPTAGTPLATGNITKTGTATIAGVNGSTNFGTLTEVPGTAVNLVITLPGQTFTAGSGNSGTVNTQTAGSAFTISAIRATDQFLNIVPSYSGAKTLSYSGPGGNADYTTSVTFTNGVSVTSLSTTLRRAESTTITANDGSISGPPSSTLTVQSAAFTKLQLLVPGETSDPGTATGKTGSPTARTAGTGFTVTVRSVDDFWNLVSSTDNISITSSDSYATLPANNTLVGGIQTFSVTLRTAGTATVTASDVTNPTRTANTSPSITVNAGAFVKLQLLVPGETAEPGSPTGKTGTPGAQAAGTPFNVTVNAVDGDWNPVSSSDVVRITSTDPAATLPSDAALVGGTRTFSVTLNTTGSQTITASDITTPAILSNTSPAITVANVTLDPATGGEAISADNAGGTYTLLIGPLYGEATSGDAGVGTIILNVPSGFEFSTGGPAPTVLITRLAGGGNDTRNINGVSSGTSVAVTSVTSTQITFTITSASNSGVTNSLRWQNVRVRPTAGTPLASGNITKTGTSTMTGVTNSVTNFGTLNEVPGARVNLVITLPGQTFTAGSGNSGTPTNQTSGVAFDITRIRATDQFLNIDTSYNGAKTLSYSGPGGTPSYTTNVNFSAGQSTTQLVTVLDAVETTTITVNDGTTSGPASSAVIVNAPTKTWDGGAATSNWGDGANWNPDGVPTSLNDVNLNVSATINVNVAALAKNVTINHASLSLTILTSASLAASGDLTMQAGTLSTEESFPSVTGTTSLTGGTVRYTRSTAGQTVAGLAYNELQISGGSKTLGGNATVVGGLTLSSGTLDLGVNSLNRLTPGGTLTVSSGATLIARGSSGGITGSNFPSNFSTTTLNGLVEFNSTGAQTIPALSYFDLTLGTAGTKTIGVGTMVIRGAMTVNGSATVDATTNLPTVSFAGTGAQTVKSFTYYTLDLTGSATKTAEGNITVNNNFSNATTLSMGTFTLSVAGSRTNTGTIQFAGATNGIAFTGGTIEYNGTVSQTVTAGAYNALIFSNTGAKQITGTVTATGNVLIGSGSSLTITASGLLDTDGDLENDGSFTNNGNLIIGN